MTGDRIKELEDEVQGLKVANDSLYKQHANEKAQMQLAIEQEKHRVAELMEANAAFREENDQWRASYEALEASKREWDEQCENEKRELEDKIASLEETIKSYTSELVNDLEEIEKEKSQLASRDQTISELQQQIDEGNDRFAQLMAEYDNVTLAYQQLTNDKAAREHQFGDLEAQLRDCISQRDHQITELQAHLTAVSRDDEVKEVNQSALLKRAEQDAAAKDVQITELTQKITQLEDEISLLTLTGGDGKQGGANLLATLRDLQQQLFQKSEELVQQGEKHLQMAATCDQLKQQFQSLSHEVTEVRSGLLKGIVGEDVDEAAYQNVQLGELVRLRIKAVENEFRLLNTTTNGAPMKREPRSNDTDAEANDGVDGAEDDERPQTHLANVASFSAVDSFGIVGRLERELRLAKSRNKRQQVHIERLEKEVDVAMSNLSEYQALKERCVDIVSRERVEKELRAKAEANYKEATEKIVALSEHIEKLMVHLKHEAAAKTKAVDLQRRTDKELSECKDKLVIMTKKNTVKDQQVQELEQGAKILEDQLRLMDEKFIDVRNKLDWTRATSQKEMNRLQKDLSALRMKWQMASDLGALSGLPDWVNTPKIKPKSKPLGTSSSESRLATSPSAPNNNGTSPLKQTGSSAPGNLSPLRASTSDPFSMRFDIPKLPQPDGDSGTPWSDAKLSSLQRQLQDKRKV